jgi:hypothetical protein
MRLCRLISLVTVFTMSVLAAAQSAPLASTPPMGWNSWDSYGMNINEKSFRANADWIAKNLKPFGYQYVTIDEGWYESEPTSANPNEHLVLDHYGRFIPDSGRFPSSANDAGFTPLADYVHSLGLKFGIHVLQGIPRKAVAENSPIEGSTFHAKKAANTSSTCQWDAKNWDLQENDAAQAYYDSIVRLYASWHVDLIKIDCIASRPYKGEEIRMFHESIVKSGAPIVLSLSPGAAPMNEAQNLTQYAQQWRISDDVWDVWQSNGAFPQGVNDQIARAAKWLPYAGPGHWPDSDMLAIGQLRPSPGYGEPRATRLTHDEQRSLINLWSIVRSPLVYGGDPVETDAWTLSLLTNPEVIAVDQHSRNNKNAILTHDLAIYTAEPESGASHYVAVFNRSDAPLDTSFDWAQIGLSVANYRVRDLWTHTDTPAQPRLTVTLAPHASALFAVERDR